MDLLQNTLYPEGSYSSSNNEATISAVISGLQSDMLSLEQ